MSVSVSGRKFIPSIIFILLSSILLLAGCSKDRQAEKDAAEFLKRAEQTTAEKKYEQIKKEKPIVSYVYEGAHLRDPFDRTEGAASVKRYADTILSNMSLDSLQLIGIIVRKDSSWAVVRGTDGKLYHIKQGMHVGVQQALLAEIKPSEIVFKIEPEAGSKEKPVDVILKVQEQPNAAK